MTKALLTRLPTMQDCRARLVLLRVAADHADAGEHFSRLLNGAAHVSHTEAHRQRLFAAYRVARKTELGEAAATEAATRLLFGDVAYDLAILRMDAA